ncbi:MAG: bacteriohemerythrin [Dehalobacterium sp.]
MLFQWKTTYTVGITEIDNQHKILFEIGSKIYDLALLKDDYDHYDEIMKILDELRAYTKYHFGFEEKLMEKSSDVDSTNKHKLEHKLFIEKLEKVNIEDIDRAQNKAILEILQFTLNWITNHILHTDQKYFSYLRS